MKPFNLSDQETAEEIRMRQLKLHNAIALADEKLSANLIDEALPLYAEARHLSLYVGEGLKIRVLNEDTDRELWNALNKKIEALSSPAQI